MCIVFMQVAHFISHLEITTSINIKHEVLRQSSQKWDEFVTGK